MSLDLNRILRETCVARAEHLPTVDSTNNRLAEIAANDAGTLPRLIVADRQTAGRGRGSNRWWTGPGSLAFSLLVDAQTINAADRPAPLASLAVAVAVAETVASQLPHRPTRIRWPNDIMVADRKLAGILIEALPDRRHIIGIGINTNNSAADAPQELQATVATMRDLTGHIVDPTEMLVDLLKKMEREFSNLCRNPEHITHRADVICWQRDRTLTMQCGGRTMMGRCRGIAADGSLRLETPEGLKNICSGVILCVS